MQLSNDKQIKKCLKYLLERQSTSSLKILISSSVVFCNCGLIINRLKMVNNVANPTGVHTKQ